MTNEERLRLRLAWGDFVSGTHGDYESFVGGFCAGRARPGPWIPLAESEPKRGETVVLLDADNGERRLAEWPPLVKDHGWTHWYPLPGPAGDGSYREWGDGTMRRGP